MKRVFGQLGQIFNFDPHPNLLENERATVKINEFLSAVIHIKSCRIFLWIYKLLSLYKYIYILSETLNSTWGSEKTTTIGKPRDACKIS